MIGTLRTPPVLGGSKYRILPTLAGEQCGRPSPFGPQTPRTVPSSGPMPMQSVCCSGLATEFGPLGMPERQRDGDETFKTEYLSPRIPICTSVSGCRRRLAVQPLTSQPKPVQSRDRLPLSWLPGCGWPHRKHWPMVDPLGGRCPFQILIPQRWESDRFDFLLFPLGMEIAFVGHQANSLWTGPMRTVSRWSINVQSGQHPTRPAAWRSSKATGLSAFVFLPSLRSFDWLAVVNS